jgi:hypothetical protein
MLITKNNPVGIDAVIDKVQRKMFAALSETWPAGIKYDCYPRCYRNKKDNGYIAEVFLSGTKKDYKEAYWDDKLAALSFFGIDPTIDLGDGNKALIHVVFFVDLKKLKPNVSERADEEVRLDVQKILQKQIAATRLLRVTTGLENVLKEYPGSYRDERLKAVDMHPVHCFRFDIEVRYSPLNRC